MEETQPFELEQNQILLSPLDKSALEPKVVDKVPLWEHWEEFVKHHLREDKSKVTISNVRSALKFLIAHTGILTLEDCNTPSILREALFLQKEKRNWSSSTLNTYRKNINTYFRWLEDMEYVSENKIMKVRKCREVPNEQRVLSEEEMYKVRNQITTRRQTRLERWRNLLLFDMLVLTGARPCELQQMQIRDIQADKNGYVIAIQGSKQKGYKRYYRMPSSLRDVYEMYLGVRQQLQRGELSLFASQSKRSGFKYKGLNGLFKRVSREVGFSVTAYSIRRFVATNLYLKGVPLKDIQQHLGHTRLTTTMRYVERTCALTDRGTDEMAKLIGSN